MLNPIGRELWEVQFDHYMLKIQFRTRMTVFRMGEGELMLCSPVPIDDELADKLARLGEVRWLLAPNLFHHMYLRQASLRYPEAEVIGVPGFGEKRQDISFDRVIRTAGDAPKDWAGHVSLMPLQGIPSVNEVLLFHHHSKSLLCTDLVFNIQREATNWLTRLVLWLAGASGKLAQSRFFAAQIKDRSSYWASLQPLSQYDVSRLVMAHGAIVEERPLERLQAALRERVSPPEQRRLSTVTR